MASISEDDARFISLSKTIGDLTGKDSRPFETPLDKKAGAALDPSTHEQDKKAREALEQAKQLFAGMSVPEMQKLNPELFKWVSDFQPELIKQLPHISPQTIQARPDVNYESVAAAQASRAPDVAAERVNANTAERALVDKSAMDGISTDPRLKQAQLAALASMQEIGSSGGMTATERAQLAKVQGEVAQADRGRREAILQNMRSRGMGGSGMELLAQLQSSQGATDRASQAGLDIAGMAQQRALQALTQAGGMAGGIRGQDFGEQSQIAAAKDAIAKFNAANTQQANQFNAGQLNSMGQFNAGLGLDASKFNASSANDMSMFNTGQTNSMGQFNAGNQLRTDLANRDYATGVDQFNTNSINDFSKYNQNMDYNTQAANTGYTNQAGMFNTQGKQGAADKSTAANNDAQMHNSYTIPKTTFDMNATKAAGQAGILGKESDFWKEKGDQKAKAAGGAIGGVVSAVGSMMSDEKSKDDIGDLGLDDIMKFLKSVKPKTYKYKPEYSEGDEGTKVGFIMQDIEGTKVGKAISREKNGMKAYDPQSLQGVMLAAIKALAEKKEK